MKLIESGPFAGLPRQHFRFIAADNPTKFYAGTKGRPQHYKRMTDHELLTLPVQELMHPEGCWLGYWVVSNKTYRPMKSARLLRPDEIAHAWGCTFSARMFVWIKLLRRLEQRPELFRDMSMIHRGMGLTTMKNAEDCFLFRRGKPKLRRGVHEVIIAPVREHSRKPEEFYQRVEKFCDGPYLDLFSRQPRAGWTVFGDEAEKFATAPLTPAGSPA